jgi:kinesin family protein C1
MGPPCAAKRKLKHENSSSALVLLDSPENNIMLPKTPSQIPVRYRAEASIATPATPSRAPKSSPMKAPFLSKDSNITGFHTEFDVRGRLDDMEILYSELKESMASTSLERRGLEDAIGHYKIRCE